LATTEIKNISKVCPHCSVEFSTIREDKIYCSKRCAKNAQKARKHRKKSYHKTCIKCGIDFIAGRIDKVYCSDSCKHSVRAKRNKARYSNDVKKRLNRRVSKTIRRDLNKGKQGNSWCKLVGWSANDLKLHLEKKFKKGMTWENYGTCWHIDHKIPKAAFNFESYEDIDFKRCWSLKNLQPMWAMENIMKSDKVIKPFQPSLAIAI
jgi:predicted nucleic acid-binding Zn ribbon protein